MPLGAAFDCFIAAADVFDDIQDDDDAAGLQRVAGPATAINVAAFLLFLSQVALGRLALADPTATQLFDLFAVTGIEAYGGQQLDIDYKFAEAVTEASYLDMVAQKSGTLVTCGCRAGALLAGSDEQTLAAYGRFGGNLGIALQLANDLQGVVTKDPARSDLCTGTPTLPLIYALNQGSPAERAVLTGILDPARRGMLQPTDLEQASNLLRTIGALEYATVFVDLYWEHALACLRQAGCPEDSLLFDLLKHLRGD